MSKKLVTTRYNENILSTLLDEKERVLEVHLFSGEVETDIGNIYVGTVKTVKKNIQSAFVDIGKVDNVFLSLLESKNIYYAKKVGKGQVLVPGDEILIQIQKDAHKTKLAKAITDFCITGRYVVLTTDKPSVFISSKITEDDERLRLKNLIKNYVSKSFGFIVRTNCSFVSDELVIDEVQKLIQLYEKILKTLTFRSTGQRIYTQGSPYMTLLKDFNEDEVTSYIYDDQNLYNEVEIFLSENHPEIVHKLMLVEEEMSLYNYFNVQSKIDKLLHKKVWLKSGASIIIEPTEALTVIDVNTEKTLSKKQVKETIFNTNMEAAEEIAYQLRARNISGIIIIDFIDMIDPEDKNKLMQRLRYLTSFDRIKTTIIDMTALGLVEVTRKKIKQPLSELWDI
jgi:ribonuclease G